MKAISMCELVMLAPNFEASFKLAVDACEIEVGAVPLQIYAAGLDRLIINFSKKLNRHQRAYEITEKGALGLVLAVKHFEVYMSHLGRKVMVYTDNYSLAF